MDRLRIDRDAAGPGGDAPLLDRAWAATRPPELSAEAFDRIWAAVRDAHDARPAVLAMPESRRPRGRALALAALGLANLAAAGLILAWALDRPDARRPQVVIAPAPAAPVVVARVDVEVDETLVLHLGDGLARERRRADPAPDPALAMNDLPETTPSDMLNHLEALAQ